MKYLSLRALAGWLLPCVLAGGCAVSSVSDAADLTFYEDAGPSSSVTVTPPIDEADAAASIQPITLDAGASLDAGEALSDAGVRDGGPSVDAGTDAGARDAGSDAGAADAGPKADASTGGGSCVPSQCSITCFTAPCCNAFDECACQDLIGLCILPGI
jgi:hypothetical protein